MNRISIGDIHGVHSIMILSARARLTSIYILGETRYRRQWLNKREAIGAFLYARTSSGVSTYVIEHH